jgi:LysM repeat protein
VADDLNGDLAMLSPQPPAPPAVVVHHVKHAAAPAVRVRVYIVQPGDNLWSISLKFYGNGGDWSRIWYANRAQIPDPNLIRVGQQLDIPGPVTSQPPRSTPAAPAAPAPATASEVQQSGTPMYYITQASRATGLSVAVVKAQNYVESSYGQDMGPSSAGAMGPWQFEPYTWPSYSSAPFSEATSWQVSTQAYSAMMRQLLRWSGGDVRMALAAYNAGQGNWQAGLGYADTILSIAGQG